VRCGGSQRRLSRRAPLLPPYSLLQALDPAAAMTVNAARAQRLLSESRPGHWTSICLELSQTTHADSLNFLLKKKSDSYPILIAEPVAIAAQPSEAGEACAEPGQAAPVAAAAASTESAARPGPGQSRRRVLTVHIQVQIGSITATMPDMEKDQDHSSHRAISVVNLKKACQWALWHGGTQC
jgi:hypothetical protein